MERTKLFVGTSIAVTSIAVTWLYYSVDPPKKKRTISDEKVTKQGFTMDKVPVDLDVIIIGSGMSGLSAGAILAKVGHKVLVLEQHDNAGGNTHTFKEDGYEFDTGLHYVGGRVGVKGSELRLLFDYVADGKIQWERMDEEYDIAIVQKDDGSSERVEINGDWNVLIPELKRLFPREHGAIDKHFQLVLQVNAWLPVYFSLKKIPHWLATFLRYILRSKMHIFELTTDQVLNSLTKDTKLQGILAYLYGDYGEIPERGAFFFNCLLWHHFRGGAFYPIGGPSVIPRNIIPVIERNGGRVLVRAPVSKILIDDKGMAVGVRVKNKNVYARKIISTVGAPLTFTKLVPSSHQNLVQQQIKLIQNPKIAPNVSLMSMFVGIEGSAKDLNLHKKNYWIYPSWDHNKNWHNYMKQSEEFPAVFVSFSSVKDPLYEERYPNKQVALIIAPSMYDHVAKYGSKRVKHRGKDYESIKEAWMQQMLGIFLREFPQCKGKIHYQSLGTAVTNDFYLGTHRGAVYGLSHTPERFAVDIPSTTAIKNLYLSGQDIFSCGIAGALTAGVYTSTVVSKKAFLRMAMTLPFM